MQPPSIRLFILLMLGMLASTAVGYLVCVRTASPVLGTATSLGLIFAVILVTVFLWNRAARAAGIAPVVAFTVPARRGAGIVTGFMLLAAALAYASYAVTGSRLVELSAGVLAGAIITTLLIRKGLWPEYMNRAVRVWSGRTLWLNVAVLVTFSANACFLATSPDHVRAIDVILIGLYAMILPAFGANTYLMIRRLQTQTG